MKLPNQPTAEEARTILDRAQRDPEWWLRHVLGDDPWNVQAKILESVRDNRRTSVRSCHAAGKSWVAARVALWFVSCFVPAIVVTTAPTFRQVQKIIWQEMRKAYYRSRFPLGGEMLLTEWKIDDGWYAFGFSTDDPDAFQGIHSAHVLLIMDEASGVALPIWEASDTVLSAGFTRFLAIGNPTDPGGPFFDECRAPGTSKIKISAFDTPNFTEFGITQEDIERDTWKKKLKGPLPRPTLISPEWVRERFLRWGKDSPMYRSRVLAEFPQTAIDALIALHLVEAAQRRELKKAHPHQLGVDVARFGVDRSVLIERWGPVARMLEKLEGARTTEVSGRAARWSKDSPPSSLVKVDPIGIGSGVVDELVEQEIMVEEVNVSHAPKDKEMFCSARDEWYWGLRQRFMDGDIDIDEDEDLAAQLSSIKYKYDSRGRVKIESKEEMKKRGMSSPNEADALMIAMADAGTVEYDYTSQETGGVNKQKKQPSRPQRVRTNVKNRRGGIL